ncbi:hypothetical protein RRG08_036864 [Elysia crispata]|uniref:Endonuclease/exonuclease/phosphatase domain-containing protein n=1 Tax=Elysia crispata TaxID=231223 RepID=A0AAE1CVG2_9GAST|nr:hypothetical protein RRG08_036864 [Elysia crispata]
MVNSKIFVIDLHEVHSLSWYGGLRASMTLVNCARKGHPCWIGHKVEARPSMDQTDSKTDSTVTEGGQCGVAPLVRGQDGTARSPVPRRRPPYATDCDSDSLAMARGQQSRTTGHLLRIAHWNAEEPRPKSWKTCGDFNNHFPAWPYKNLDAKGGDVEDWIASNKLMLINTPYDEPIYFSRSWITASTPDLAQAKGDIQRVTQREVCFQLGVSDHRPVILNVN